MCVCCIFDTAFTPASGRSGRHRSANTRVWYRPKTSAIARVHAYATPVTSPVLQLPRCHGDGDGGDDDDGDDEGPDVHTVASSGVGQPDSKGSRRLPLRRGETADITAIDDVRLTEVEGGWENAEDSNKIVLKS